MRIRSEFGVRPHAVSTLLGGLLPSLLLPAAVGLFAAPKGAGAQELTIAGQLRPRFESRWPAVPSAPAGDVTMRARIWITASLPENATVRVDLQDVVTWGQGSGPGAGALTSTEFHQAYLEVGGVAGTELALRLGRQDITLGNERLVSRNNWSQRGQRFDGARILGSLGGATVTGLSFRLADPGPATGASAWFHGAYAELPLPEGGDASVYLFYDRSRNATERDRVTFGGHGTVTLADVAWGAEAFVQRGTLGSEDLSAHLLAASATGTAGGVTVVAAADRYSGDSDLGDGTATAFDRLFGSNHGYHGYADLFRNIPNDSSRHGLWDFSLRGTRAFGPDTRAELKGHVFRTVETREVTSSRLGEEVDLVITHAWRPGIAVEVGGAYVFTGPAIAELRALEDDLRFGYVMLTASF